MIRLGVKERKARQKKFLRQEILDAAGELFVKEGYEQVSMRRIADRIEYSPTTIYLYFKDKSELLEQVCHEAFSRLSLRLKRILEQPGDPVEHLREGLIAYVHFGMENPHQYRAAFMMPKPENFDKLKYDKPDSPGMQAFDFLRRSVQSCKVSGKLRVGDVELASQMLWCGVHGVTALLITHEGFPWVGREQVIHSVVDTLIAGMSEKTR
jgi:AcrR family transcriptional regulator